MSSQEDEAFRRLVIMHGLFEESEEVQELLNRIIDSPSFPKYQTPEQANQMLAEIKERIRSQTPHDAVEADSESTHATAEPGGDVASAPPRDRAAPESDRTRPPTRPEITLAASTSDEKPPTLLAGVITGPDGRDQQISLKVIDHFPDVKLIECVDFDRIAEELDTTDLGLFILGEYVAALDPCDHCAEVLAVVIAKAEREKAEVRVAPYPDADS